jgi:hypothetical protein
MTRSSFIAMLLAATTTTAHGQSKVLVLVGEIVDNEFFFGRNADDPQVVSQRVLVPNQGLHGISSEETIIMPDSSVNNQNPLKPFVATQGFPAGGGDAGPIERICLDGGQSISLDTNTPDVAHAIQINAHRPAVRFCRIANWKGIGIETRFDPDPPLLGTASHQIMGNTIEFCHTGIRLGSGDQKIIDNTIIGCRDYGLYIPNGNTHNVSAYNHYYGINNSDNDGTAVHNDDDAFRSMGDTFADSHYGYIGPIDTDFCVFYNLYCQRINRRAMLIEGTENTVISSTFNLPRSTDQAPWNDVRGVEITGARNTITGSTFWLSDFKHPATPGSGNGPATAIKVSGNDNRVMSCHLLDFRHPAGYARGIHLVGAVQGFEADVSIWGFDETNDVLLKIDSNQIDGVNVVIRGNSADLSEGFPAEPDEADAAHYVDIPSGWDGDTNSITLIDEATGNSFELVGGTQY